MARSTACPFKSDLKSLVWYMPSAFAEKGYEVPTTLDDFVALTEQMIANGDTPAVCRHRVRARHRLAVHRLGRGADPARPGHRLLQPVGHPRGPVQLARDRRDDPAGRPTCGTPRAWCTPTAVSSCRPTSATTPQPLVDGDCMMHRQASFFAAFFPGGAEYRRRRGPGQHVLLPGQRGPPELLSGDDAAAFRDAPEVWAVMQYLASPEFADARQKAQAALAGGGIRASSRRTSTSIRAVFTGSSRASSRSCRPPTRSASTRPTRCPPRSSTAFWAAGDGVRQRRRRRPGGRRRHRGGLAG